MKERSAEVGAGSVLLCREGGVSAPAMTWMARSGGVPNCHESQSPMGSHTSNARPLLLHPFHE